VSDQVSRSYKLRKAFWMYLCYKSNAKSN
jgi:hypothetical protein